ncbi:MAG: glycogen/starch/alpha-glucan phosphorylase [Spongiibacteraceae bacterium]
MNGFSSGSAPVAGTPTPTIAELPRLGMDADSLVQSFRNYLLHALGRDENCHDKHYLYAALALAVRARLFERWRDTVNTYDAADCRRTYYMSLEFLMGRALGNALLSLDIRDATVAGLQQLALDLEEIVCSEPDAGLGNGGLGRLAACFLDSCATLQLPVSGYGIRYAYGMFRQSIANGHQVEEPDNWLREGNPWELERPEFTRRVHFGGRTQAHTERDGRVHHRWLDTSDVLAVPFDFPIPGYRNETVNTLRLWSAKATDVFDLGEFNAGSYTESVRAKNAAENITMVLYPNDNSENGKELRLRQQYFLASATLQDVIASWKIHHHDLSAFAAKNCFQLNDTHPTISIPEMMRLLLDEELLSWDAAWAITCKVFAYTNHTVLPEALERWPVSMFQQLLPRIMEIIFEINARFLAEVSNRWPGDIQRLQRMSLIEEGHGQQVRMANLAIVGSFSINGVAALHSHLLETDLFRDFYELWPEKFNNKTNGVTQRRWLAHCNPQLRDLISGAIGDGWIRDMEKLQDLRPLADDAGFRASWMQVKHHNKQQLAAMIRRECFVEFETTALFDVQVKRIHEYKRQLLNVLHVIHLYQSIKQGNISDWTPRCVLFGGKAAPGYHQAKLIIKLIGNIAQVINNDPVMRGLLSVAFVPNYRVTAMEVICPGTDLSEQISTAGKEASGTSNMKFMMNGALTIGTLDGANIEIREALNGEHFFLFGLTAEEVVRQRRHYNPDAFIMADQRFSDVMALLENGHFNRFEPGLFDPIVHAIHSPNDPWLVAADFSTYTDAQLKAAQLFRDREAWAGASILNAANSGHFSSDRTIREYNRDIWKMEAVAPRQII